MREVSKILFNVQNVRVKVHVLVTEWIDLDKLLEPVKGYIILLTRVASMGNLVSELDTACEVFDQSSIEVDAIFLLVNF